MSRCSRKSAAGRMCSESRPRRLLLHQLEDRAGVTPQTANGRSVEIAILVLAQPAAGRVNERTQLINHLFRAIGRQREDSALVSVLVTAERRAVHQAGSRR